MLKIKLFAACAFLACAACAFLLSNDKTRAQSNENAKNRDAVLEKIAGYKNWQRVVKPEIKSAQTVTNEPTEIFNSAAMG